MLRQGEAGIFEEDFEVRFRREWAAELSAVTHSQAVAKVIFNKTREACKEAHTRETMQTYTPRAMARRVREELDKLAHRRERRQKRAGKLDQFEKDWGEYITRRGDEWREPWCEWHAGAGGRRRPHLPTVSSRNAALRTGW